jgi:hypothetical protein
MKKWDGMTPKTEMKKRGVSSQWPHVTEMKTQNAQHQPQIPSRFIPVRNKLATAPFLIFEKSGWNLFDTNARKSDLSRGILYVAQPSPAAAACHASPLLQPSIVLMCIIRLSLKGTCKCRIHLFMFACRAAVTARAVTAMMGSLFFQRPPVSS